MEFFLNVSLTKKKKNQKSKMRIAGLQPMITRVRDTEMAPLYQRDKGNKPDPKTEPNSCFSDFSDSVNSLNSMKVLLHLGKTPVSTKSRQAANKVDTPERSRLVHELCTNTLILCHLCNILMFSILKITHHHTKLKHVHNKHLDL